MSAKKKLLVTASTFPRWENDTEPRFVLDLCKAMTEYFDITVLVPATPGAADEEVLEGVHVVRYHYLPVHKWETLCYPGAIVPRIREKKARVLQVPFLFLGLYVALKRLLPQYDMVHAHWLIPQGIVQSFFNKPYIVTGHGGDVTSLNKGIALTLKKRCIRKATTVTAVSEHLKQEINRMVPDKPVSVISMGVNVSAFGRQYRIDNYFGQNGKPVVLFVGRLAEKKGVVYLIRAMKNINAKLVIVGTGPLKRVLKDAAWDYSVDAVFLGSKTHEELKTIFASADAFVMPSVTAKDGDVEGFGLVMLEAMASGLPIVASRSGGITDLIKDGENGLLCEEKNVRQLANQIRAVLGDKLLSDKLRINATKTVIQYDYETISRMYAHFFGTQQIQIT